MAPRWGGLRLEPYDPDARDADGDGIVQEGTAWERPGGTRLVSAVGNIVRGRTSTTRPRDLQVVDRNGKPVMYTPTYGAGVAGGPAEGTALSEHGTSTLQERGLRNVRQVAKPVPRVPQEPADTRTPADRARERNAEIQKRLTEAGAKFGQFDLDILGKEPRYQWLRGATRKERASQHREIIKDNLERLQNALRTELPSGDDLDKITEILTAKGDDRTPERLAVLVPNVPIEQLRDLIEYGKYQTPERMGVLRRITPEQREFLLSRSPQELTDLVSEEALKYQNALTDVRVRMTPDSLMGVLETGRVKTTHEVDGVGSRTMGGGLRIRKEYETMVGVPLDIDPDLRPVSGYAVHPDTEAARRSVHAKVVGQELSPNNRSSPRSAGGTLVDFGGAESYGGVVIQLRPEVSERSAVGLGDSLSVASESSPINTKNPDDALLSMMSPSDASNISADLLTLRLLEGARIGDQQHLNQLGTSSLAPLEGDDPQELLRSMSNRDYLEVLIPGGIEVDDIQEVRVPSGEDMDRVIFQTLKSSPELQKELTAMMTVDGLEAIGVPRDVAEEWLAGKPSLNFDALKLSGVEGGMVPVELRTMARQITAEKILKQAQGKGITLTFFGDAEGQTVDLFDPKAFDLGSMEELRQARSGLVRDAVVRSVEFERSMSLTRNQPARPPVPGAAE